MLLPPLCSQANYVKYAELAGLVVLAEPFDISQKVSKTWQVAHLDLNKRAANDCFQGYFLVTHSIARTLGFCGDPRPRWASFSSSLPGNAERFCKWDFPVRGDGF
jgi:hypothetical protein